MSEKFTRTISTVEFTETPRLSLEQATGDLNVEGWDRPEIKIETSDEDEVFDVELAGSQVVVRGRPFRFNFENLGSLIEPAIGELENLGLGLEKVAGKLQRKAARSVRHATHRMRHLEGRIDMGRWAGGRDYYIKVPHDCDLTLRTSTGDVRVTGVNGTIFVQSTAGDTRLAHLSGNVLVSSASGDISIDGVEGKLGVRAAAGDLHIRGANLQEVSASTASGDILLGLLRVPDREFEVKTVSGDLNLEIPSDARLTAEISTFSGDINCEFPHEQTRRHPGRTTNLVINGGGTRARFASISGDVSIERGPGLNDDESAPSMDLARAQTESSDDEGSEDIREPESYAERKQAELEVLQAVERGELSPQEALQRLAELG